MQKLINFSQYMKDACLVKDEHFDSWAENIELAPAEKHTVDGLLIGHVRYTAVISLEHSQAHAILMMALIMVWLKDHDRDRADEGLPNPQLNVDITDSARNISDIEIELDFKDEIILVKDAEGLISYLGENYGLGEFDLWTATTTTVAHNADA